MMKKLLLFFALFSFAIVSAQGVIPVKLLSNAKSGPERYVGADAYGSQYTIFDNEFRKDAERGRLKFKVLSLGQVYRADIQNPLQLVLFYKAFNTAVLLDNQLNETSRINFSNIPQPIIADAVGLASQNRLWVYDINTQQIGLYDLAQGAFRAITPPFNDRIRYYQNDYNYFYWIDSQNRCHAVNLFGKVNFLGNVPEFGHAQFISSGALLLSREGALYHYNLASEKLTPVTIVEKSFRDFYLAGDILSIFTDSEIIQYKVTLPK